MKLAQTVGVTDEMIHETLVEQENWVASGGQKGQQAVFAGLDLSGRDLSGANLAAANLEAATLVEVNFSGAMLAAANLRGANLLRANLSGADLRGANLLDTNLRKANVRDCKVGELPGSALLTLLRV